jgi:hypothetical protein
MSVNIDELSTEVSLDGGGDGVPGAPASPDPAQERERMTELLRAEAARRARTAARGLDD